MLRSYHIGFNQFPKIFITSLLHTWITCCFLTKNAANKIKAEQILREKHKEEGHGKHLCVQPEWRHRYVKIELKMLTFKIYCRKRQISVFIHPSIIHPSICFVGTHGQKHSSAPVSTPVFGFCKPFHWTVTLTFSYTSERRGGKMLGIWCPGNENFLEYHIFSSAKVSLSKTSNPS